MTRTSTPLDTGAAEHRPAYWTHDDEAVASAGHMYYFAPLDRAPAPYKRQRHVTAIIDIAADGTLAGVELIDDMPPPPTALFRPIEQGVSEEQVEAAEPDYWAVESKAGMHIGLWPSRAGAEAIVSDYPGSVIIPLYRALAAARLPRSEGAPTHRHKKRGEDCVLLGFGKMQIKDWHAAKDVARAILGDGTLLPVDNAPVAIYRSVDDGLLYVRPRGEFEDGPASAPAQHPPRSEGWRTMDSAPKDGTVFLATSAINGTTCVVGYQPGTGDTEPGWTDVGCRVATPAVWFNPRFFTHWQPLPAPPKGPSHD